MRHSIRRGARFGGGIHTRTYALAKRVGCPFVLAVEGPSGEAAVGFGQRDRSLCVGDPSAGKRAEMIVPVGFVVL